MVREKYQLYVYGMGTPFEKRVLRSTSKNAFFPSQAQQAQRDRFGRVARGARGLCMEDDDVLPPAAVIVRDGCRGPTGLARPQPERVWERELRENHGIARGAFENCGGIDGLRESSLEERFFCDMSDEDIDGCVAALVAMVEK